MLSVNAIKMVIVKPLKQKLSSTYLVLPLHINYSARSIHSNTITSRAQRFHPMSNTSAKTKLSFPIIIAHYLKWRLKQHFGIALSGECFHHQYMFVFLKYYTQTSLLYWKGFSILCFSKIIVRIGYHPNWLCRINGTRVAAHRIIPNFLAIEFPSEALGRTSLIECSFVYKYLFLNAHWLPNMIIYLTFFLYRYEVPCWKSKLFLLSISSGVIWTAIELLHALLLM